MKMRRFISVLIGLVLIALMVYKFVEVDRHSVVIYYETFPNIVNLIIYYALFAVKVITILLIAIGSRKTLIASLFLIPVVIAFNYDWSLFDKQRVIFQNDGFKGLLDSLGRDDYLYYGAIATVFVYWLFLLIFVLSKNVNKKAPRSILFVLGLVPLVLYYGDIFFISKTPYVYEQWETVRVITDVGMTFFITLMLMLSQEGPKKVPTRHVWFPIIDTI